MAAALLSEGLTVQTDIQQRKPSAFSHTQKKHVRDLVGTVGSNAGDGIVLHQYLYDKKGKDVK